jgi:hypothetical protein
MLQRRLFIAQNFDPEILICLLEAPDLDSGVVGASLEARMSCLFNDREHLHFCFLGLAQRIAHSKWSIHISCDYDLWFLLGLGFELRALHLQSRHSATLGHTSRTSVLYLCFPKVYFLTFFFLDALSVELLQCQVQNSIYCIVL